MSEKKNTRTEAVSTAAAAASPGIDSISERVKQSRRNPEYVRNITDYFSKKRGPKTKFANKSKKARTSNTKNKKDDNADTIELSFSSTDTEVSNDNDGDYQEPKESEEDDDDCEHPSFVEHTATPEVIYSPRSQSKQNKERKHRIEWSDEKYFPIMKETIEKKRRLGKLFRAGPMTSEGYFVP